MSRRTPGSRRESMTGGSADYAIGESNTGATGVSDSAADLSSEAQRSFADAARRIEKAVTEGIEQLRAQSRAYADAVDEPALEHSTRRVRKRSALERMTGGGKLTAPVDYLKVYRAEPTDRIHIVKKGISPWVAKSLVADLAVEQAMLFFALNLSTATVNRKVTRGEPLASDEGERVVGVAKLVGQLQAIVEESGDPSGFDARAWISNWLREPLPALGGARPLDLLDTMEGQSLVSDALARVQSGAYA